MAIVRIPSSGLLRPILRGVWIWWVGEIAGLLPTRARQAVAGWRRRVLVLIDGEQARLATESGERLEFLGTLDPGTIDPAQLRRLLDAVPGHRAGAAPPELILRLDPATVLQVPMALPMAALANLEQVIAFEFERFTPFQLDSVYFAHRIVSRDAEAGRLRMELTIVSRSVVDGWIGQLRASGLRIGKVEAAGSLLPAVPRESSGKGRALDRIPRFAAAGLVGLAGLLAVAAMIDPILQARARTAALGQQVAQARREADAAQQLRKQIDAEVQDGRSLALRKTATPSVTQLLGAMTHLLPDDTWLSELQINGDTVQISGFASSATALLTLLDGSPLLANAAFRSSVTRETRYDRERFDIAAQIRQRADR